MDGAADAAAAPIARAESTSVLNWKDSTVATEISKLTERREDMKKERKTLLKDLKNKRKRLGRLKKKASQLSDRDLFDIAKSRQLQIHGSGAASNEPRGENDVAAETVPPSTD